MRTPAPTDATVREARVLLLAGQGLKADPVRAATRAAVRRTVSALGFVQVDAIQAVARAHHLILAARLDGYRPEHLKRLLEEDRSVFEHWTHDASIIPTGWLGHWVHRFQRQEARLLSAGYRWRARLGEEPERLLEDVQARVTQEGPLRSADFDLPGGGGTRHSWWGRLKPAKFALELLWHSGRLAITRRDGFQKVYDLLERTLPGPHPVAASDPSDHLEWACSEALRRLGFATPTELARFFDAVPIAAARKWSEDALQSGRIVSVRVADATGSAPRDALAQADWRRRVRNTRESARRIRVLCPFDPLLRDRDRTRRTFGFDYRFEGFVPAAKRRHGYYVMAILDGEQLVGRFDPRFDRSRGVLEIRRVRWEPGVRPSAARRQRLERAIERLAVQIGADRWSGRLA